MNIQFVQFVGVHLELRLALEDYVVLIQLRVHGVDLALAESVVESVVDRCRSNAETRSSWSVNDQGDSQSTRLLVGARIGDPGSCAALRALLADTDLDSGEVAFLLGFEELNSFTRAFRAWEGTTPTQWRAKQGSDERGALP